MTKKKSSQLAILLIVIADIISGINTPVIHSALNTIPTSLFGFLRLAIPLVILTPMILLSKRKRPKPKYIAYALLFGLMIYYVSNGLFYLGVKRSGSVNAAIIGLIEPLLMFTFSVEVMREKFDARILVGMAIAFAGSMLVVFGPMVADSRLDFSGSIVGNLLLVGCALASVAGIWTAKIALKHIDYMQLLFWSLIPGTIIFGITSMREWGQIPAIIHNSSTLYAVLFGAIGNGLITYLFSFYALKRIKGEEYGIFEYINPGVAAVVAVIFFGETFTPLLLGGVFIIFAGLYLAEVRHHRMLPFRLHSSRGR